MATGVQLMLLRDSNPSDKDTYRHDYIPRLGRAASPLLERALDDPKATLFDGFVEPYLRAGAAEMKEGANTPKFALLSLSLNTVGEGDLQAADDAVHSGFAALGHASFEHRTRFPQMHLAMLVVYADLAGIASNWEEVPALARQYRGFAFVAPRAGKGSVFVMAGRDGETVAEVVRRLAAATSLPERGLVVSVP